MIEIKPNALYTRDDIIKMLAGFRINPDAFIARIKPVKRFRHAWWGQDLIDAIARAPRLEHSKPEIVIAPVHRRRGRPRKSEQPVKMIGRWTEEELGLEPKK